MSTVSPGFVSGNNTVQELTAIDLAMKLHYLRFVYYFKPPAFDGLTIEMIKETMCNWLNHAYIPCGRFRRADSGRPFIICNDSGVRLVEASCQLSLDAWLESNDDSRHKLLVPNHIIGPDIAFSPLVMIQLTNFKCGATSVGMSWPHVLGDVFSAVGFITLWAQVIAGQTPAQSLIMDGPNATSINIQSPNPSQAPLSIKRVGPVGDLWCTSDNSKMETFSFYISMTKLIELQEKICEEKDGLQIPPFECICVVIWKCMRKIKDMFGPEVVTVCKSDMRNQNMGILTIGVIETNVSIAECNPMELGSLFMNQVVDERMKIEEAIESDENLPDFLIYGANLTFVDFSDAMFYEIEVRGQKPIYVNCVIDNIGDEGVVLVLLAPNGCFDGRIVSITLPENKLVEIKAVLEEEWCIA